MVSTWLGFVLILGKKHQISLDYYHQLAVSNPTRLITSGVIMSTFVYSSLVSFKHLFRLFVINISFILNINISFNSFHQHASPHTATPHILCLTLIRTESERDTQIHNTYTNGEILTGVAQQWAINLPTENAGGDRDTEMEMREQCGS